MLKLSWHIGDVVRKLRTTVNKTQGELGELVDPPMQANTVSDFEKHGPGYSFRSKTLSKLLACLNLALKTHFNGQLEELSEQDLYELVPVQRSEAASPEPRDSAAVVAERLRQMDSRDRETIVAIVETLWTKRRTPDTEASDAPRERDHPPNRTAQS